MEMGLLGILQLKIGLSTKIKIPENGITVSSGQDFRPQCYLSTLVTSYVREIENQKNL